MVPKVKQWSIKFRHEADEYRGRMGALSHMVQVELPRMIALIDRTATALEKYADVAVAPDEEPHTPAETSQQQETA
jgi:hypothetical protein